MKATDLHFPVVMYIIYAGVCGAILKCDHSSELPLYFGSSLFYNILIKAKFASSL